MKRLTILLSVLCLNIILPTGILFAQVPERMSYQAVIRDKDNELVRNSVIRLRISILQDSVFADPVYSEEHTPTTNDNGLISLEVGNGVPLLGHIDTIDWSKGPYFLKSEIDPEGNFNYSISGTNQLLAVPYALHAKTADSVSGLSTIINSVLRESFMQVISSKDTSYWNNKLDSLNGNEAVFNGWDKNSADDFTGDYKDLKGKPTEISSFNNDVGFIDSESDPVFKNSAAAKVTFNDITKLDNLSGINTGDQDLSSLASKTALADSAESIRNDIPDVSTFLSAETDPQFYQSVAAGITEADTAAWNAASVGSYIEADPEFTAWDKSSGILISRSQVSDLSFDIFEKELSDNENNIDVGFNLESTSIVFINGTALSSDKWSGIGTQILNLEISAKKYDKLKIKN